MMDAYGFMDTELSVDDVLDFCMTAGDTRSRFTAIPNGDREFDLYEGSILRMMSFMDGKDMVTHCYDDNGELHDWGSRAAVTYRNPDTFELIMKENFRHGTYVEKLMRVPFKNDFADLD